NTDRCASRVTIFGASRNPRLLSGRSKSLTSKSQSDLACLIIHTSLAMVLYFPEFCNNHARINQVHSWYSVAITRFIAVNGVWPGGMRYLDTIFFPLPVS